MLAAMCPRSNGPGRPISNATRRFAPTALAWGLLVLTATDVSRAQEMIQVSVGAKRFIGAPLFVSTEQVLLMLRDGRIRELPGTRDAKVERLSDRFEAYSAQEVRGRLRREFDERFDITLTNHYVIVHPKGHGDAWGRRFETLLAHFIRYFAIRGMEIDRPSVPLVALVMHDRNEFFDYARSRGDRIAPTVVGYYSSGTNRIALYESGRSGAEPPASDLATIYHEAAHQAAFNTGVHSRLASPPNWASEGLGTLFESPGVWGGSPNGDRAAKTNARMLQAFRATFGPNGQRLDLRSMIDGDELFDSDPEGAYARAWAVSFFLAETRPAEYAAYLAHTAGKPDFHRTSVEERRHDWETFFPDPVEALEIQLRRFTERL